MTTTFGIPQDELIAAQQSIRTFLSDWYSRLGVESGHRILVPSGDLRVVESMLGEDCDVTYVESEPGVLDEVRQSSSRKTTVVQACLSALPMPDSSFDRVLFCMGMHDSTGNLDNVLTELTRVTTSDGKMLVMDKVDMGLHEPSLEEEAEYLFMDIQKEKGVQVLGIQSVNGYHKILRECGWVVREQRIWGAAVRVSVSSPEQLGLDILEAEVEMVNDAGMRSKYRDRLNRLMDRAHGRPALAARWAAIAVKN